MKKKFSVVFLVVLMIASLFVSCDNGIKNADPVAKVLFVDADSLTRGLNSSSPEFDATKLYWTYEAQKMDNSGLKTGETSGPVAVSKTGANGLGEAVGPFSLGVWKFTLHAHETSVNGAEVYTGTVSNVVVKAGATNKVNVKVHAIQEGQGKIEVLNDITLHDANGNPVINYDETITLTNVSTGAATEKKNPTERIFAVDSGAWKVTVSYVSKEDPSIVYGSNSIYVTVFANQTVTISGSLEEITADTSFEVTEDGGLKAGTNQTVAFSEAKNDEAFGNKRVMNIAAGTSPVITEKPAVEVEKKTTVTIPENAVVNASGEAKLNVTSYAAPVAGKKFTVVSEQKVVSAIDLDLTIGTEPVTTFNEPIRVVTYIPTGLANVDVIYAGDGAKPTDVRYNAATGELSFMTTHFSAYCVVADNATSVEWGTSEETVYLIHDASELKAFRDKVNAGGFENKKVQLAADIYLFDEVWTPIGTTNRGASSGFYNGEFDGAGHKIYGLNVEQSAADKTTGDDTAYGFFGVLGNATIKNLTIESGRVHNACDAAAGIAGAVKGNANIIGCVNKADIRAEHALSIGDNAGAVASGIVGRVISGNVVVKDCINYGNVTGFNGKSAGIVGMQYSGAKLEITNCKNLGTISDTVIAAGIIGNVNKTTPEDVTITNCVNHADITAVGEGTFNSSLPDRWVGLVTGLHATPNMSGCTGNTGKVTVAVKTEDGLRRALEANVDVIQLDNDIVVAGEMITFHEDAIVYNNHAISGNVNVAWDGRAVDLAWYDVNVASFTLTRPSQLAGLAKLVNSGNTLVDKTVNLGADMDLCNNEWTPIGCVSKEGLPDNTNIYGIKDEKYFKPFLGTFNGQQHTISNLYMAPKYPSAIADDNIGIHTNGLFGIVSENAVIENCTICNVDIEARGFCGSFVGYINSRPNMPSTGVTLRNLNVCGTLKMNACANVGGILGRNESTNTKLIMDNCHVKVDSGLISQDGYDFYRYSNFYGGLVGAAYSNSSNIISNCSVSNMILDGKIQILGGLVGHIEKGSIADSAVNNVVISLPAYTSYPQDSNSVGAIAATLTPKTTPTVSLSNLTMTDVVIHSSAITENLYHDGIIGTTRGTDIFDPTYLSISNVSGKVSQIKDLPANDF